MTMPPAAFMRATISESCGAICPASSGEPMLSGSPATADSSLMAIGKPCIQPMLLAARQHRVALVGLLQQAFVRQQADQRVDLRVQRIDARQVGLHHLACRHVALVDGLAERAGIERGEVVVLHGGLIHRKDFQPSRARGWQHPALP